MARKNQARKSKEAALSAQQLHELTRKAFLAESTLRAASEQTENILRPAQTFIDECDCAGTRAALQEKYEALRLGIVEVLAQRDQRRSSRK